VLCRTRIFCECSYPFPIKTFHPPTPLPNLLWHTFVSPSFLLYCSIPSSFRPNVFYCRISSFLSMNYCNIPTFFLLLISCSTPSFLPPSFLMYSNRAYPPSSSVILDFLKRFLIETSQCKGYRQEVFDCCRPRCHPTLQLSAPKEKNVASYFKIHNYQRMSCSNIK
jgi:hypothetical protein